VKQDTTYIRQDHTDHVLPK